VEAFVDALAAEMARFNVKVSVLDPGNYQSEIEKTLLARMNARGKTIEGSRYEKELRGFLTRTSNDPAPDDVAEAALAALGDPNPKLRYLIVPNQREAEVTIRKVLLTAAQLNQGQRFSYSRDSLVAMLDQALRRVAAPTR
jgi:NAD(P)-dependent dehydrogenase (short-subunit alcohol dehydrogenase family)